MNLNVGDAAPAFTLPDAQGNSISLADFQGQYVVVYFYPKDDTPGCTKEACGFRDQHADLLAKNAVVLGISKDGAKSHDKFITKYELPFTLLSDEDCAVATAYDSYGLKKFMGKEYMGMMRHTFVIDPAGNLAKIYTKVKAETHAAQVLADLAQL
jgi:thioredoxin-dependent peroxiredoxin